jgi:hypothetical protein
VLTSKGSFAQIINGSTNPSFSVWGGQIPQSLYDSFILNGSESDFVGLASRTVSGSDNNTPSIIFGDNSTVNDNDLMFTHLGWNGSSYIVYDLMKLTYDGKLYLYATPSNDASPSQYLTRVASTGEVRYSSPPTPYSYTLFVDPSGNNSTAVIGDYTRPWQTINAAINYAGTSSQPTGGYTLHIFRGNYTETTSVTFDANESISFFFEPNVNLTVTLASVGYWFTHNGGLGSVNVSGSGKSNYISSNFGVFRVGANGQSAPSRFSLNINNITISSSNASNYTSTGNGVVIYSIRSTVNIDNSIVSLTTAGGSGIYQYVIWLSAGYLNIFDSTLNMSSQTGTPTVPSDSGSLYGWLIWEDLMVSAVSAFPGVYDAGRIKLQNAYLSQSGTGGGGAIRLNGIGHTYGTSSYSILLANFYFRCGAAKMMTVYSYPKQDAVWIGGSVISGGSPPDASAAPSLNQVYQYPAVGMSIAQYSVSTTNMPRPY